MDKYLITRKSQNPKTGPILVTTSPRRTCPLSCPLRKHSGTSLANLCYAEHGMLGGFLWSKLDQFSPGDTFQNGQIKIHDLDELLRSIRALPHGSIWRHNQAGDLATNDQIHIDANKLSALVQANCGRDGFTYTHFDVLENAHNRAAVYDANRHGFTINLSANSLEHAVAQCDANCGPVATIVASDQVSNTVTPKGRKVIICPASMRAGVTCATCRLCARQRDFVIAFPALGKRARATAPTPRTNHKPNLRLGG
ncbi:MAG: hypothetical protein GY792_08590 [Gammaproteobacteria bacterium]|nr:hypothetical protein [Gammaproteobacteria bacterium]